MGCVVFMHAASASLRMYLLSDNWMALSAVTSLAFCAVPLFFMISGALLSLLPDGSMRHTASMAVGLMMLLYWAGGVRQLLASLPEKGVASPEVFVVLDQRIMGNKDPGSLPGGFTEGGDPAAVFFADKSP